jgi:hypothetical protein
LPAAPSSPAEPASPSSSSALRIGTSPSLTPC